MRGIGDPEAAEVLIVNTCGFINSAKQESIEALRELAAIKRADQMVIAAGCLSQRYGDTLVQEVPGLDGVIGTRRWMDIFDLIRRLRGRKHPEPLYHLPDEAKVVGLDERGVLRASLQGASAYLKIADGCRRPCAFCAIPAIKGTAVSRPLEAIVAEAARLGEMGVKEVMLIAQDSTDYGYDLGLKDGLAQLLDAIVEAAPGIPWLRIMYAYPGYVTPRLMETMAKHEQILPYLDIPLQHGHRETLKRMRRPAKVEWVYETIGKLRELMPELAVRTTFIVGYPGETEDEFAGLLRMVRDLEFDRVGAFQYSYELGTPSAALPDHVDDAIKQERYERLMEAQQGISLKKNQALVGRTLDILVEGSWGRRRRRRRRYWRCHQPGPQLSRCAGDRWLCAGRGRIADRRDRAGEGHGRDDLRFAGDGGFAAAECCAAGSSHWRRNDSVGQYLIRAVAGVIRP